MNFILTHLDLIIALGFCLVVVAFLVGGER
jgi:hypothetical protein